MDSWSNKLIGVFELVRDEGMEDSEWIFYTEMTYEITYMDSRLVSVLLKGVLAGTDIMDSVVA